MTREQPRQLPTAHAEPGGETFYGRAFVIKSALLDD
jgi:hypothetical protein